jgi:hypothetical protein
MGLVIAGAAVAVFAAYVAVFAFCTAAARGDGRIR